MHKFSILFVCGAALALSACGGDSDSSGMTHYGSTPTPTVETCSVVGKTITGTKDKSCTYENDSEQVDITLTCNNGKVVLDGKIGSFSNFTNAEVTSGAIVKGYVVQCV